MRRLIALVIAALFVLGLYGCQAGTSSPPALASAPPAADLAADRARVSRLNAEVFQSYRRGLFQASLPRARETLALGERSLGPEHPEVAQSLINLGRILVGLGNYAEARPLFERCLAIRERAFGPSHVTVGNTLAELGDLHIWTGDYAAARPHLERALRIREQILGPRHVIVGWSHFTLGRSLGRAGDYSAARPFFERAVAVGDVPPRTSGEQLARLRLLGLSLHWLALVQWRTGERRGRPELRARAGGPRTGAGREPSADRQHARGPGDRPGRRRRPGAGTLVLRASARHLQAHRQPGGALDGGVGPRPDPRAGRTAR